MKNKKVCVVTGTRAEYGLLYWVMKKVQEDADLTLQILVTGAHLSPEFGNTYLQIEKDGFTIDKKVEILLSGDTPTAISKSMGLGLISFSEAFTDLQPDIILLLGDRYEILAAATAAMSCRIPIAHCHGGETTEGAIDESIRHAVTKMSHLHFTSTEAYRKRVVQLGEQPEYVRNVGALGAENILKLQLLNKEQFEESINFRLNKKNLLVTYHPVTLENNTSEEQVLSLLNALDQIEDCHIIFTKANADTNGRIINQMIDQYVANNPEKSVSFTSLGQLRYLSAIPLMDAVVGNSSSGIIEVPYFNTPTINIGDRQKGRISAPSVIHCGTNEGNIADALDTAFSEGFKKSVLNQENPYGKGLASDTIIKVLKSIDTESLLKKSFYDIEFKL